MAPKTRRILLITAGIAVPLLLLAGGGAWYTYRKATALPDWYRNPAQAGAAGAGHPPPGTAQPPPSGPHAGPAHPPAPGHDPHSQGQGAASTNRFLDAWQMHELVAPTIAATLGAPGAAAAVKATRATIDNGRLDLGVVIDVGAIPVEQLDPRRRAALEKALDVFPGFEDQEVFLGVRGQVAIDDGYVRLGEGTRVSIGGLELSPRELAGMMGQDQVVVWLRVRYQNRDVRSVRFEGNRAALDLAP